MQPCTNVGTEYDEASIKTMKSWLIRYASDSVSGDKLYDLARVPSVDVRLHNNVGVFYLSANVLLNLYSRCDTTFIIIPISGIKVLFHFSLCHANRPV